MRECERYSGRLLRVRRRERVRWREKREERRCGCERENAEGSDVCEVDGVREMCVKIVCE